jgi:hypothetical protein
MRAVLVGAAGSAHGRSCIACAAAALAQREGVSRSYFTRLVRLSYLAPDITQAILGGSIANPLSRRASPWHVASLEARLVARKAEGQMRRARKVAAGITAVRYQLPDDCRATSSLVS